MCLVRVALTGNVAGAAACPAASAGAQRGRVSKLNIPSDQAMAPNGHFGYHLTQAPA